MLRGYYTLQQPFVCVFFALTTRVLGKHPDICSICLLSLRIIGLLRCPIWQPIHQGKSRKLSTPHVQISAVYVCSVFTLWVCLGVPYGNPTLQYTFAQFAHYIYRFTQVSNMATGIFFLICSIHLLSLHSIGLLRCPTWQP